MDTLSSILKTPKSYGPYPKAARVLVVDLKMENEILIIGLADATGAIKAVCYEKKLVNKFKKNQTVLVRNFQKGRYCMIINKMTQVVASTPLQNIDEGILHQAGCLVNPPPPELVSLKDIAVPTSGTPAPLVTVCGKVVQDETAHVVGKGAQEVRNILLKEDETTHSVALWNKSSRSPMKTGDKVTITHVSPRNDKFLRKLALSSTNDTTITIHVPPPSTIQGTIVGIEEEEEDGCLMVTVLTEDGDLAQYSLPSSQASTLLKGTTIEKTLENINEKKYVFSLQGSMIQNLTSTLPTSASSSASSSSTSTNTTTTSKTIKKK